MKPCMVEGESTCEEEGETKKNGIHMVWFYVDSVNY